MQILKPLMIHAFIHVVDGDREAKAAQHIHIFGKNSCPKSFWALPVCVATYKRDLAGIIG